MIAQIISRASCAKEAALLVFLLGHAEALLTAAALLGSRPAVSRTARLLEELSDFPPLSPRLRQEIVELHRLLTLDRVDDFDGIEAACFAEIDPASPVVEEICGLADSLRTHLFSVAEEDSHHGWEAIRAA